MTIRANDVLFINDPADWEKSITGSFLSVYHSFYSEFQLYGIQLMMKPCYYYNGKYHSTKRNSGCSLVFRIRLFPNRLTYSQAVRQCVYQEFFSQTLAKISKKERGFEITKYNTHDASVERFLNKYLRKARLLSGKEKCATLAIRESATDILRSLFYIFRYKNEAKHTLNGVNLEYLFLAITAFLIAIRVYWRLRRLGIL